MTIYITHHALQAARRRVGNWSERRLRDEALTAMVFGKRKNNTFIYEGIIYGFNNDMNTLKTVCVDEKR